jgi:glutaminase
MPLGYQAVLEKVYQKVLKVKNLGSLATYIPELANVNPEQLGVYLYDIKQNGFGIGDEQIKFSIQSIAKVLSCALAYSKVGETIWTRVGVEPSGSPFNSLLQLESDKGIPRNPFINAGALVISDILISELENPKKDFLDFVRNLSDLPTLDYAHNIALSEKSIGYRNIALCNYLKALGNLNNEPEVVLDFYFHLCSIEMSCQEVARTFLFLANQGCKTSDIQQMVSPSQAKRLNALMLTCGFYDESGEFAFNVGLPGKSGVGGGIIAILPNQYSICVWSPRLNEKGNSHRALHFLEQFTTYTESSIF